MKRKYIINCALTLGVLFLTMPLHSQTVNSIYSMYGIGQTIDNNYGINRALGGTGIAFQSGRSINHRNPASYAVMLPNSFLAETGGFGMVSMAQTNRQAQLDGDMRFNYFSASFYMHKNWGLNIGVTPFSSIQYQVDTVDEISGELVSFDKSFSGTGGLYQANLANSVKVFKGLSVGLNLSYIFGMFEETEKAWEADEFPGYELLNECHAGALHLDYGLQYSFNRPNYQFTLGAVYSGKSNLSLTEDASFTFNNLSSILESSVESSLQIPQKFGVGIAIQKFDVFRVGFDYEFSNWSSISYANENADLVNSNRYSVGLEYFPRADKKKIGRSLSLLCGAYYKNTYLELKNNPIHAMGANLGVSVPFGRKNTLNLSVEYGNEGTLNDGLIRNDYVGLFVNVSLYEFLYKRQ